MYYINWKYNGELETIDQAETHRDASYLKNEYNLAYGGLGYIYVSTRWTKYWRESND